MSSNSPIKRVMVAVDETHVNHARRYLEFVGKKPTRRNTIDLLANWARQGVEEWSVNIDEICDTSTLVTATSEE